MDALRQDLAGPDAADLGAACLAVARRLALSGTLWCAAPSWPGLADEAASCFERLSGQRGTHPARAVPEAGQLVDNLRAVVSGGDVLVLMARAGDKAVAGLRQRAGAWGLLTVWIGRGERPQAGAADFVLWDLAPRSPDDKVALAAAGECLFSRALDCLGQIDPREAARDDCTEEVCITCSDEGRLGEVVATGPDGRAEIRTPFGLETVDTTLIDDPEPGDLVLIHAGAALCLVMKEAG